MNATTFKLERISNLMSMYSDAYNRSPRQDIAIWETLDMYYSDPEGYNITMFSTKEEAFERMLADNWKITLDFYGLDYQVIDEVVLDYLIKNKLATYEGEEEDKDE